MTPKVGSEDTWFCAGREPDNRVDFRVLHLVASRNEKRERQRQREAAAAAADYKLLAQLLETCGANILENGEVDDITL